MILGILLTIINPLLTIDNIIIYSSLLSLILIYRRDNYHYYSFIIGLIFDLISSTYILNSILYLLLSFIISYYFKIKKYNLKNIIIISIFIIFIYNFIYYLVLNLLNINTFNFIYFITDLVPIYIINILFISMLFLIINIKKHS